jgi:hypothetical protein
MNDNTKSARFVGRSGFLHRSVLWIMFLGAIDSLLKYCNNNHPEVYDHAAVLAALMAATVAWWIAWAWSVAGRRTQELGLPKGLGFTTLALGINVPYLIALLFARNKFFFNRRLAWSKWLSALNILMGLGLLGLFLIIEKYQAWKDFQDMEKEDIGALIASVVLFVAVPILGGTLGWQARPAAAIERTSNAEELANDCNFLFWSGLLLAALNSEMLALPESNRELPLGIYVYLDAGLLLLGSVFIRRSRSTWGCMGLFALSILILFESTYRTTSEYGLLGTYAFYLLVLSLRMTLLCKRTRPASEMVRDVTAPT